MKRREFRAIESRQFRGHLSALSLPDLPERLPCLCVIDNEIEKKLAKACKITTSFVFFFFFSLESTDFRVTYMSFPPRAYLIWRDYLSLESARSISNSHFQFHYGAHVDRFNFIFLFPFSRRPPTNRCTNLSLSLSCFIQTFCTFLFQNDFFTFFSIWNWFLCTPESQQRSNQKILKGQGTMLERSKKEKIIMQYIIDNDYVAHNTTDCTSLYFLSLGIFRSVRIRRIRNKDQIEFSSCFFLLFCFVRSGVLVSGVCVRKGKRQSVEKI